MRTIEQLITSDLRGVLPRAKWSIGTRTGNPTGAVLHYNGPAVLDRSHNGEVAQLIGDARWHLRPGALGAPNGGDGLQYHLAIGMRGEVYWCRELNAQLWHARSAVPNNGHLAVHVPIGDGQTPSAVQWAKTLEVFEAAQAQYGWAARSAVTGHKEWAPTSCPGSMMPMLEAWRKQTLTPAIIPEPAVPDGPRPGAPSPYTENALILGPAGASSNQCVDYIMARGVAPEYSRADIQLIVSSYFRAGELVYVDPVGALAQSIHETGCFTSFWARRPRRNPAGIGVDGTSAGEKPANTDNWAYNTDRARWEKGVSFSAWASDAVPAHIGRLLAFSLTDDAIADTFAMPIAVRNLRTVQRAMIVKALSYRPLSAAIRGTAKSWRQLGKAHNSSGYGWASPGTDYGVKIAKIANEIARFGI